MKVIMLNSTSLNSMICYENGDEDFLSDAGGDYVTQTAKKYGCIIWGRRAYENVKQNLTEFDAKLEGVFRVIVSADPEFKVTSGYYLANSPKQALELIENKGLKVALLDGGGKLNTSFLKTGLVDEIHLLVEPVVVGAGLPVISKDDLEVRLSLISSEVVHDGEVLLKYKINK